MFTGIIETTARIVTIGGSKLQVETPAGDERWRVGESVAISGVCLTVIEPPTSVLTFDLSEETLRKTSLSILGPGARVNIERAMRADDRLGGHLVQGHVDAVGRLVSRRAAPGDGDFEVFRFSTEREFAKYLAPKGSVSVDGISLTIVDPTDDEFDVWLIPHTMTITNLGEREAGDPVNLEFDAIAKYVERLMGYVKA